MAGIALLLSLVGFVVIVDGLGGAIKRRHDPSAFAGLQELLNGNNLPVVFEEAKDYLAAREINPEMRDRLYYAAEPELALKLTHANVDDILMRGLASIQDQKVVRLDEMARASNSWIVVPGVDDWLMPCLNAMHLDMRPVSFSATNPNRVLSGFRLRLPPAGPEPLAWCEAPQISPRPNR